MDTANHKERILVVEDNIQWAKSLEKLLRDVGDSREVEICDIDTFRARFPTGRDFEDIVVCLTDLELAGDSGSGPSDTIGLTEVLPRIRAVAPWVPVGCITRWVSEDISIVKTLSESDFDMFLAKKMFTENKRTYREFNADIWQSMLQAMQIKRVASLTGRSVHKVNQNIAAGAKLTLDKHAKDLVACTNISIESFGAGLAALEIDGSELAIETMQPGFSGLQVSRVHATGHSEGEPMSAHWLLKWGRPIYKLAEEAVAHRRYFKRGLDRALQIPQLHPNVIAWDGVGYLAYAFERDAKTALRVSEQGGVACLEPALKELAAALYSTAPTRGVVGLEEIVKWVGLTEVETESACMKCGEGILDVSWSLIHGDLHLRNIFIRGGRPTLIDFARSGPGPIAIDIAKIAIDTLAFAVPKGSRTPKMLTADRLKESALRPVLEPFLVYLKGPGDMKFLESALRAYAQKYLSYADVNDDVKALFCGIIKA